MRRERECAAHGDDAAQRAREGQSSFEQLNRTIPWRSVSDSEGVAAFAMLGLQQEDIASSSNSREHSTSSKNSRVDSGSWSELLASGGEVTPASNIGGRVTSSEHVGGDTRGQNIAGGLGGYPSAGDEMSNDPGPMPNAPPFGGFRLDGGSSRSRSGASTDSRTGPLRTCQGTSLLLLSSGNYGGNSVGSWSRLSCLSRSRSGGGAGNGGVLSDCRGSTVPCYNVPSYGMDRQHSFDPHRDIDPRSKASIMGSQGPVHGVPWARSTSSSNAGSVHAEPPERGPDIAHYARIVTWNTENGGRRAERYLPDSEARAACQPSASYAARTNVGDISSTEVTSSSHTCWAPEPFFDQGSKRKESPPHDDRPTIMTGEQYSRVPMAAPAPVDVPRVEKAAHSYHLLAMMIPDLSKMASGTGGAISRSTKRPRGELPAHESSSGAALGPTVGVMRKPEVCSSMRLTPSSPCTPPTTMDTFSESGIRDFRCNDIMRGRGVLLKGRQAAIARYRYKKGRRHLAQRQREEDPEREHQIKSRERPRKQGRFEKTGQDFVSITKVQAAADMRSCSSELLASEAKLQNADATEGSPRAVSPSSKSSTSSRK